jgi:hypothetical protein
MVIVQANKMEWEEMREMRVEDKCKKVYKEAPPPTLIFDGRYIAIICNRYVVHSIF